MAHLVKDYDFGFPLTNIEQLNNIERNILTDDGYASTLVINSFYLTSLSLKLYLKIEKVQNNQITAKYKMEKNDLFP